MIIYTKKDATIIIPCGLGPSVCPDVSHELQTKTVDSSTVLQQVEPDSGYYGLSSVTVEPYTVESDSSTLTENGTYTFTPKNADTFSSVTVDVSVNNWIFEARAGRLSDISGYSIAELVKTDSGAAGLFMFCNGITALPLIQDPVDNPNGDVAYNALHRAFFSCQSLQSVDISLGSVGDYGMKLCFAFSTVEDASIYLGAIDTSSLTECFRECAYLQNLYIKLGPEAGIVGINTFGGICRATSAFMGNDTDTTITIEGLREVGDSALNAAFYEMHVHNSGRATINLPDNLSTVRGKATQNAFSSICKGAHLTGRTTPSFFGKFDYISGNRNCVYAFMYSDIETATLGFNTCSGGYNFEDAFAYCYDLKTVTFDGTFDIYGSLNFNGTFKDCKNLTSMICTSTAGTKPFHRYEGNGGNNVASSAPNITDITIDNVNSDVYLHWNPSINAASVYGILSKAVGATVQEGDARKIEFYGNGLTVKDYSDGRIQTAYNAAVADGWTINYLTILPYSNS